MITKEQRRIVELETALALLIGVADQAVRVLAAREHKTCANILEGFVHSAKVVLNAKDTNNS
jgi:hypothetical protein